VRQLLGHDALAIAGQLAYFSILFLFPFLIFIVSLVGLVVDNPESILKAVVTSTKGFLPQAAIEILDDYLDRTLQSTSSIIFLISCLLTLVMGAATTESIIHAANLPAVVLIRPTLPYATLADFVSAARERPGKFNYASAGLGNWTHLFMAYLNSLAGIDQVNVVYRSGAEMLTALLRNEADTAIITVAGTTKEGEKTFTVDCPATYVAISGGYDIQGSVTASYRSNSAGNPTGNTSWTITQTSGNSDSGTAYVYCMKA
jgi:hypothetical protein